jgi:hypothetical protein
VSRAGGYEHAVERARAIGADAFQVWIDPPQRFPRERLDVRALARLRRAVGALDSLEHSGTLHPTASNGDTAKAVAVRLSRAVDELEMLLREVQPATA